eukprot:gene8686-8867_t
MATLALMRPAPSALPAARVSSPRRPAGTPVQLAINPKTGGTTLSSPGCSRPRLAAPYASRPSRTHIIAHGQGESLHLGLNFVNPDSYNGWDGELAGCINDAKAMDKIAKTQGIKSRVKLIDGEATRAKVLEHVRQAAGRLQAGDYFLLTYSGHGGQVRDVTGEEDDRWDETWCLHDGQLIDDELYLELTKFAAGVRILVLSDSCHSGTMLRAPPPPFVEPAGRPVLYRQLPPVIAQQVYDSNADFYDNLQKEVREKALEQRKKNAATKLSGLLFHPRLVTSERFRALASDVQASILLISGCLDHQLSADGKYNGLFTEKLLYVWNGGSFQGSHVRFHSSIVQKMPQQQTPNLFALGPTTEFAQQRPFTV